MRVPLTAFLAAIAIALAPALAAQALTFDDFTWTFQGTPTSIGFVTSDLMHVSGPAWESSAGEATFTTTAPFAGTVRAHVDWVIQDICHFDWPGHVLNGQFVPIDVGWQNCWSNGEYLVAFDVQAGDSFGLGVGSADGGYGPGIADFTEFTLLPPAWSDAGGALDPRVELDIAGLPAFKSFGSSVAALGDVDGDGLSELAVLGSTEGLFPKTEMVFLYSGSDGSALWAEPGATSYLSRLVPMGDVNGDGLPDLAVSNYGNSTARLLSGTTGTLLWTWTWSATQLAYYTSGMATHADVDGDGVRELAVGASNVDLPVRVLSGASGVELALIAPLPGDEGFGYRLCSPGDLDGDGAEDLLVVAGGSPKKMRVFSGATHALLLELSAPGLDPEQPGPLVFDGAGDWNLDGVPDVAVGWPYDYLSLTDPEQGAVTIHSGATGDQLLLLPAPEDWRYFGFALAGGTDVDSDGAPDLAIGAPESVAGPELTWGKARVVRAPDGGVLQDIAGLPDNQVGSALAWQSGASAPTLFIGMPGVIGDGRVRSYSDLLHPMGAPDLSMYGAMETGVPWSVRIEHGLPANAALLVAGWSAPSIPFKGGTLVPAADLVLAVALDGSGVFEDTALAPAGLTPDLVLWLQAWMPDPAGPQGWSATRARKSPPP